MKQKIVYETTDGKEFADRCEADEHQKHLDVTDEINAYLDQEFPEMAVRARSRVLNTILRWEMRVEPESLADITKEAYDEIAEEASDENRVIQLSEEEEAA